MNRFIFFIAFIISLQLFSQNKKIVANFTEIPETLLINPGAEVDFQWHVGMPLLSGLYAHVGISDVKVSDLFLDDGIDFNTKLEKVLTRLDSNDFYTFNQQLDIINFGFKLPNNKDYISGGFYTELDFLFYHPKDLVSLVYDGNTNFSKQFKFNDLSFKTDLTGVMHIGINRKINDKLTLGTRFKIYSSVFNASSTNNQGAFITTYGENNFYRHQLANTNVSLQTSGLIHNEEAVIGDKIAGRFLASGNMGIGFDFGLTYHVDNKWKITASFQDLGFIRHTKNTTVYKLQGNTTFEGINLEFPETPINYLKKLNDDIPTSYGSEKFTTFRSLKFNGSLIYGFGQVNNNSCLRSSYEDQRRNELGLQLFTILRPKKPQAAATLFYYKKIANALKAKVTYTVDSYSATNIGFGFSTQIGIFNLYASADNLLGYTDLAKSNNQTINFGINFALGVDKNKP